MDITSTLLYRSQGNNLLHNFKKTTLDFLNVLDK